MGISATDTNETIALIDYVEGVDAGIEAGLDGEPPTWDEVPECRGSALAEWVGKYPNLFERMCGGGQLGSSWWYSHCAHRHR